MYIESPKTLEENTINLFLATFRSENTRLAYKNDLNEFFQFCSDELKIIITSLDQITERLILIWKNNLAQHSLATQARKISALSSFLEFARRKKFIAENPARFIQKPKVSSKGKTNALTYDEVVLILKTVEEQIEMNRILKKENYKTWKLRYAVLHTLFTVGMRVSELCTLKISSLENAGQFWRLHMQAKGNETHSPIIHNNTAKVMLDYKKEFRADAAKDEPFFVSVRGEKGGAVRGDNITELHRSSVFDMLKKAVSCAGINKNVSPHSCRASLATLLHAKGVPLLHIKELLNHKAVTTTARYVK